ncbi:DNA replication protein [Salmonella enterica]|nr:DNA replication protein [Salmonella enterica]
MIDMLALRIPFKDEFVTKRLEGNDLIAHIDLADIARLSGIALSAYTVEYAIDGDLTVSGLKHAYESLPTHYSGIALKVFEGGKNFYPCVEIKASPAKVLQGHNVFGPVDLELCGTELLGSLAVSLPALFDLVDVPSTTITRLDVTYSARVENDHIAKQVISFLRNISNGQTKKTRAQDWDTTVMWNENSRHRTLVAYLKFAELMNDLKKLRDTPSAKLGATGQNRLKVMSNPDLHDFASGLVRFEARLKTRFLKSFGFPEKFVDAVHYQKTYVSDSGCVISDLWKKSFSELFKTFEGSDMNVYDDSKVYSALINAYSSVTPSGKVSQAKANRCFGFYRRLLNEGYDNVSQTMERTTFWRNIQLLTDVGLSKAQLMNLTAENNVIPLMRIINVDFSNQFPVWYQEPQSRLYA